MKKLALLVSLLVIAVMAFASAASAQQASVFGNGVLVRAFITETGGTCSNDPAISCTTSGSECGAGTCNPLYSADLEVRDETGRVLPIADFTVTGDLGTMTPEVTVNPFQIHNNDLVNNDITLSFDSLTNRIYVFCTNANPGLHVMAYNISLNTPVNGVCVTYSQGLTQVPTNLCAVGPASGVNGTGPWSWTCSGANGGLDASCIAQKKVDGVCGSSNGQTFTSAPTSNLCNPGSPTTVTGSGPWNWTCTGSYGGASPSCSASAQSSGGTPDLIISSVSTPNCLGRDPFIVSLTIKNQGLAATTAPFTIRCNWTTNTTYSITDAQLFTQTVNNLLSPAQSMGVNAVAPGQSGTHQYFHVVCMIDSGGVIAESNETNNIKASRSILME